ncbi:MAG: hypothetical protein ACO3F5_04445 [Gemmatimonadaceae bacterium]
MRGQPQLTLGLAVVGALLFLVGVQRDDATLRWMGVWWLGAAFLSRFLRRSSSRRERPLSDGSTLSATGNEESPADG